jgi:hypothetical protein
MDNFFHLKRVDCKQISYIYYFISDTKANWRKMRQGRVNSFQWVGGGGGGAVWNKVFPADEEINRGAAVCDSFLW